MSEPKPYELVLVIEVPSDFGCFGKGNNFLKLASSQDLPLFCSLYCIHTSNICLQGSIEHTAIVGA